MKVLEPLKGKDFKTDCEDGLHWFMYCDVKSAVELLKQKAKDWNIYAKSQVNLPVSSDFDRGFDYGMRFILKEMDEVFEDVIKGDKDK